MALLETVKLEHLPSSHIIHIALFRDVKNAAFLQQQLLAGNTDFEYALIDASVIVSKIHALAAAYRAINDLLGDRLRSRNVHSEIVFSLSPNNNIAESFRRFGITPSTTSLLVIKLSTPDKPFIAEEVQSHLSAQVEGEQIPFTDDNLSIMTDLGRVRKIYKMNTNGKSGNGGGKKMARKNEVNGDAGTNGTGSDMDTKELEVLILGSMALRGATN